MRRLLIAALVLLPTAALAEETIAIHPFEMITRSDLDGKFVQTYCHIVGAEGLKAVCLAPDGFGEFSEVAAIDVSFAEAYGMQFSRTDLDRARRDCGSWDVSKLCRISLYGRARQGGPFPRIDAISITFRD